MRSTRISIALCCFLAAAVFAWSQGRKAGLYEVTTNVTWQQSPLPGGAAPGGGAPRTSQICVTQEQIDKYNGIPPQTRGDCQVTNMVKRADGYSAEIACKGQMTTKGTVETTYDSEGHGKSKIHLVGALQMGPNTKPIELTSSSESTYKGADCGSVKPINPPPSAAPPAK